MSEDMSDEEILAEIERLKEQLATRQTRQRIAEEFTERVDELRESAGPAMEGTFDVGRVHVCPDCVRVYTAPDPDDLDDPDPEPEEPEVPPVSAAIPWEPDLTLHVGETTTYEGRTYLVRLTHETHQDRLPPVTPSLYREE